MTKPPDASSPASPELAPSPTSPTDLDVPDMRAGEIRRSDGDDDSPRTRLYEQYATHHAGRGDGKAVKQVFRRDLLPHLPRPRDARILDVGCGQGDLVAQCHAHGYHATSGVDVSAKQVAIAQSRGIRNVMQGDAASALASAARSHGLDAVIATDLLEHLRKDEVLALFDSVVAALRPGGVFVVRTPNAVSPWSGSIQYGDFTHETVFTPRSIRQIGKVAGFTSVTTHPCAPMAHSARALARCGLWKLVAGVYKFALAVETGDPSQIVTINMVAVARR